MSDRGTGGRDHHLEGTIAMFAGGLTRGGIAYGEMDARGESPIRNPLPFGSELFNTIVNLAGGAHHLRPGSPYIHELVRGD